MANDIEFNREFFVQAGKRGGLKTKKLYGKKHFVKIAKRKKK